MGDRPAQELRRLAAHNMLLRIAEESPAMCDEVYVQVMKQLTDNPSQRSTLLGWELLRTLCQEIPPSTELMEFVYYFARKAAQDQMSLRSRAKRVGDGTATWKLPPAPAKQHRESTSMKMLAKRVRLLASQCIQHLDKQA